MRLRSAAVGMVVVFGCMAAVASAQTQEKEHTNTSSKSKSDSGGSLDAIGSIAKGVGDAMSHVFSNVHWGGGNSMPRVVHLGTGNGSKRASFDWLKANGRFGSGYYDRGASVIVRKTHSRAGEPNYGTIYGHWGSKNPVDIPPSPPTKPIGPGQPHPHPPTWGVWHGVRVGYATYIQGFIDDLFCYSHYVFDASKDPTAVISPWYCYENLPPYIEGGAGHVVKPDGAPIESKPGAAAMPDPQAALQRALDDLVAAWENDDQAAVDRLAPKDGLINVSVDGQYRYSLQANDFYDLLHDGIENTKTFGYGVIEQKQVEKNVVDVVTKHDYRDPWGRLQSMTHRYTLVLTAQGYVIRSFDSGSYKS